MEDKFYNDNFEQLLKDATDDFRMYPSRRVWHSLYNDLHPAKRWPSLAVCLLLISAVLYIGISNNNSINSIARRHASDKLFAANMQKSGNPLDKHIESLTGNVANAAEKKAIKPFINNRKLSPAPRLTDNLTGQIQSNTILNSTHTPSENPGSEMGLTSQTSAIAGIERVAPLVASRETEKIVNTEQVDDISENTLDATLKKSEPNQVLKNTIPDNSNQETLNIAIAGNKTDVAEIKKIDYKINADDLSWIENYAFHNKSFARKWKNNRSVQYYITPSIGYRHLEANSSYKPASTLVVANSPSNRDINDAVNQNAAINLEAGTTILFDIMKKIRLKTGIQFNYTNYISNTFELKHPTQNTILLNDMTNGNPMIVSYNTIYTNNPGSTPRKLNNKTIQLSIPIGADVKLAGKNNLKWYAGLTVQPTYVASGNVYLLSSDTKNYIDDQSLLRKWNINGGFETFVSYKTASGISINVGPQFRYQFLSTYTKQYSISENLYNVGLKMGITRSF